jgi:hypothetical protein
MNSDVKQQPIIVDDVACEYIICELTSFISLIEFMCLTYTCIVSRLLI